jgi:hypothetical protein
MFSASKGTRSCVFSIKHSLQGSGVKRCPSVRTALGGMGEKRNWQRNYFGAIIDIYQGTLWQSSSNKTEPSKMRCNPNPPYSCQYCGR